MKKVNLDQKIAEFYAPLVTEPIKYGESGVFFWFPGSGMTTILNDIFTSKILLKKHLGVLSNQLKIINIFGHLAEKRTLESLLNAGGFLNETELKKTTNNLLNEGFEVVFIIGRIDDYSTKEKLAVLKLFVKINAINSRRIHILFNTVDKPWFVKALNKNPELLVLANRLKIIPVLNDSLLTEYIINKAQGYNFNINLSTINYIQETYGGILQLTKEYLRSHGNTQLLDLKLKIIWNSIPKTYKDILKNKASKDSLDLKELGVIDLNVFKNNVRILESNPTKILNKILTTEELALYNYLKDHGSKTLSKDTIISILRPTKELDSTVWAIDKAISRFRKKLAKSGIDPTKFKTLKGKGYIWE